MNRLTSNLARTALATTQNVLAAPTTYGVLDRLRASPRQIDACAILADAGLGGEDLVEVCRGRLGIEAGTEFAFALLKQIDGGSFSLPQEMSETAMPSLQLLEEQGKVLEVTQFLRREVNYLDRQELVARYLIYCAQPETVRALQIAKFSYVFKDRPIPPAGGKLPEPPHPLQRPGKPWQWYAVKVGKLTSR